MEEVVVVGIGDERKRDDAVGLMIARELMERALPENVRVEVAGEEAPLAGAGGEVQRKLRRLTDGCLDLWVQRLARHDLGGLDPHDQHVRPTAHA